MSFAHWLRLLVAAVLATELLLRLPLLPTIRRATSAAAKSQKLLKSKRISDHWKERLLPYYALVIGRNSVFFFVLLCAAILPVVLIGLTDPAGIAGWGASLLQPRNLIGLVILSLGYVMLRGGLGRGSSGNGGSGRGGAGRG